MGSWGADASSGRPVQRRPWKPPGEGRVVRGREKTRSRRDRETRDPDVEEIRGIIEPVIEDEGFELLDLVYVRGRASATLKLVLDHPEAPVNLGDCSRVSRAVGRLLDGLDLIPKRYQLEVSSPGIDRILRKERDFVRFCGSLIRVSLEGPITDDPEGRQRNFSGRLAAYDPETGMLLLETEKGPLRIPRARISRARLVPEFSNPGKPGKKGRKAR